MVWMLFSASSSAGLLRRSQSSYSEGLCSVFQTKIPKVEEETSGMDAVFVVESKLN